VGAKGNGAVEEGPLGLEGEISEDGVVEGGGHVVKGVMELVGDPRRSTNGNLP